MRMSQNNASASAFGSTTGVLRAMSAGSTGRHSSPTASALNEPALSEAQIRRTTANRIERRERSVLGLIVKVSGFRIEIHRLALRKSKGIIPSFWPFEKIFIPMPLTIDDLRRFTVARNFPKPTTLGRALRQMGFVQADPIRPPARAQDLLLR